MDVRELKKKLDADIVTQCDSGFREHMQRYSLKPTDTQM